MATWYEEMAIAMKKREVAINGLKRWQTKVAEAEATIQRLSSAQLLNLSTGESHPTQTGVFTDGVPTE